MNSLLKNKKGFTLIELLAVIVILAILVMLAIPAVTRYLTTARKNAYSDNALRAVEAVRNDVIEKGFSSTRTNANTGKCNGSLCYYNKDAINSLLETKLVTSSFGNDYAYVCIVVNQSDNSYTMSMVDKGGNGFVDLVAGAESSTVANAPKPINAENIKNDGSLVSTSGNTSTYTSGAVAKLGCS